ncbi:MAG: type II toxin-antitoxin system Phd/YefM family antitoxin [Clostridiaceae bacterium]|nr:type II toxin-antitoxin system Phd/YefM family antitoxin [Clostridiaceae bacterium]
MEITSTRLKNNLGEYLKLAAKEDIIITKNGKRIAKLVACNGHDEGECNECSEHNEHNKCNKYNEHPGPGYADSNHNQYDGSEGGSLITKENMAAYGFDRRKVTYEEFLEITANSEERYEYIDGEIYLLASPKTIHQRTLLEMAGVFYNWFKGKKCTPMFAPYDIKLNRSEFNKNVVQPDLMVICDLEEKLDENDYYTGVPALMVEITSASTKSKDYVKKLDMYMSCGVGEYWIVDTEAKETHVFCFKDKNIHLNKTYSFNDEIKSFYFEGLSVSLREFFTP